MRRLGPMVVVLAMALSLATSAAPIEPPQHPPTPPGQPGEAPSGAAALVLTDQDGDGISDSLQQQIEQAAPGDKFDVIAIFTLPQPAAAARAAVGDFTVTREFSIINAFEATMTAASNRPSLTDCEAVATSGQASLGRATGRAGAHASIATRSANGLRAWLTLSL